MTWIIDNFEGSVVWNWSRSSFFYLKYHKYYISIMYIECKQCLKTFEIVCSWSNDIEHKFDKHIIIMYMDIYFALIWITFCRMIEEANIAFCVFKGRRFGYEIQLLHAMTHTHTSKSIFTIYLWYAVTYSFF